MNTSGITNDLITSDEIDIVYRALKARVINPQGKFDNAGRWYPSDAERAGDSYQVRTPSRAYPFSYMARSRTKAHVKLLAENSPDLFWAQFEAARKALG